MYSARPTRSSTGCTGHRGTGRAVAALLGRMTNHLDHLSNDRRHARSRIKLAGENGQLVEHYDVIFRELFCIAASTLASRMTESLLNVGVLWDEIFATGIEARPSRRISTSLEGLLGYGGRRQRIGHDPADLLEKGHWTPARGIWSRLADVPRSPSGSCSRHRPARGSGISIRQDEPGRGYHLLGDADQDAAARRRSCVRWPITLSKGRSQNPGCTSVCFPSRLESISSGLTCW